MHIILLFRYKPLTSKALHYRNISGKIGANSSNPKCYAQALDNLMLYKYLVAPINAYQADPRNGLNRNGVLEGLDNNALKLFFSTNYDAFLGADLYPSHANSGALPHRGCHRCRTKTSFLPSPLYSIRQPFS